MSLLKRFLVIWGITVYKMPTAYGKNYLGPHEVSFPLLLIMLSSFCKLTVLFFKLTDFSSISEWKQIRKLSSAFLFFSAFSLGCSDKTLRSSLRLVEFIMLVNSLFMYYINLKMLTHVDVITYLHLLLTLYYLLFIYIAYLGCIMIIMCMCRSSP